MVDILAVGAHPDDIEIAIGGTLIKLKKLGYSIAMCHSSNGEPTPHGTPERRIAEAHAAAEKLGAQLEILDIPNRYFTDTIENRVKIANVIRKHRPRMLLGPYPGGDHPDHRMVSHLTDAARFTAKLTKYDHQGEPWELEPWWAPRQLYYFLGVRIEEVLPTFIVDITEEYRGKMEVLSCYQSQFNVDMNSLAASDRWGPLIGKPYGEAFWSRQTIGINDLMGLVMLEGRQPPSGITCS